MQDFKDRVAVITGAASGIGRSLAHYSVEYGMKVLLADVNEEMLMELAGELKSKKAVVATAITDVSKFVEVERLAEQAVNEFGAVHLLFNNVGATAITSTWSASLALWEQLMNVNFWSVVYGIQVFVPVMINQDTECNIVNTASGNGLTSSGTGIYRVLKHGVVSLSESLYNEMKAMNAKVNVSVLCPGDVRTNIMDTSKRNLPKGILNRHSDAKTHLSLDICKTEEREKLARHMVEQGIDPDEVAKIVFRSIRKKQFYILTHPQLKPLIKLRMQNILSQRNPT